MKAKKLITFKLGLVLLSLIVGIVSTPSALAQTTGFTYQGKLNENGMPASAIENSTSGRANP
ncbi:MAG: hypothetical protein M3209_20710 [Acidobacteriota bacterium]|nr:hypothetical protein [Acidobacteriota bacterium]